MNHKNIQGTRSYSKLYQMYIRGTRSDTLAQPGLTLCHVAAIIVISVFSNSSSNHGPQPPFWGNWRPAGNTGKILQPAAYVMFL